jgi:hypothetical protein
MELGKALDETCVAGVVPVLDAKESVTYQAKIHGKPRITEIRYR